MKIKRYHLGDILSVTHGRLVSPRHIDGVYDILNYLTGDNLFTHQLPRASEVCKPHLLKQHPQLKEVSSDDVTTDNWEAWLDKQIVKHGETLEIAPLPDGQYQHMNPISELVEHLGVDQDKVIIVDKML